MSRVSLAFLHISGDHQREQAEGRRESKRGIGDSHQTAPKGRPAGPPEGRTPARCRHDHGAAKGKKTYARNAGKTAHQVPVQGCSDRGDVLVAGAGCGGGHARGLVKIFHRTHP